MISDWASFLAYPNLFGIKGFVIVVVIDSFDSSMNELCSTDKNHQELYSHVMFKLFYMSE
jgi:hypothetical protein